MPVETLTPTQIKSTIATLALMIHNQLSSVKCQDGRRLILQNSNNTGRSEEKIEDTEGIFFLFFFFTFIYLSNRSARVMSSFLVRRKASLFLIPLTISIKLFVPTIGLVQGSGLF